MSKSLSNAFIIVLATVGCFLTLMLTIKHFKPDVLPCTGQARGCEGALGSAYGKVGPVPTAVFGMGMYIFLLGVGLKRRQGLRDLRSAEAARSLAFASAEPVPPTEAETAASAELGVTETISSAETAFPAGDDSRTSALRSRIGLLDLAIWGVSLLGVCISYWLQYVSLYQLRSFCPYCMSSAILISLICLLATLDQFVIGKKLAGEQKMLAGVLGFIGVMMLFIVVPSIIEQINNINTKGPQPPTTLVNGTPIDRNAIIRPDLHLKGDPNALYTLVEFADYQCPVCKRAAALADEVIKRDPRIRLAFRNYPLSEIHQWAKLAAVAAEAAAKQGKFWEMHDIIYANQDEFKTPGFTPSRFDDWAREIGLNMDKFQKDRADPKIEERVVGDHADGDIGGTHATPTFFFVSKTQIFRIESMDDLQKALADPKHPMWK